MLDRNPVPDDPRRESDIYKTELLSEEIGTLHLLGQFPLGVEQILEMLLLLGRILGLGETHGSRDDVLVDEVDPDARVCLGERIGGEDGGFVGGVGVVQELAEDEGFVEGFALVLDCGNEALRVNV